MELKELEEKLRVHGETMKNTITPPFSIQEQIEKRQEEKGKSCSCIYQKSEYNPI